MPKLISQLDKAYRRNGWPFSWPANLLWAKKYGTTPDRFDYGAAVFADIPTDVGGGLPDGYRVEATHPFFQYIVREQPVVRKASGVVLSQPTTIWINLARLPKPYELRLGLTQSNCCSPVSVKILAGGKAVHQESFSGLEGRIGLVRGIPWKKGTNPITIEASAPIILKHIDLLVAPTAQ